MAQIIPLHRGYVRPFTPADLAKLTGDHDAVFTRFSGPAVHERIGGCPRWLDVSAKAFIIAAGVVSVAIWVAF